MTARIVTALEAAITHIDITHSGDIRRAIMRANRREQRPEPLPREIVQAQGWRAWIMATANDEGVHVMDSDGETTRVAWHEIAEEKRRGTASA